MRRPQSMKALEELGRVRLSPNFFMRDFLYSEIASYYRIPNIPDDPDLAIEAGQRLCENLLEPLTERFGRISVRSSFRSKAVNQYGNKHKLNCGSNESNFAGHIWDERDAQGNMGATTCIILHAVIPYYERTSHWQALAWWIHDNLPYHSMQFFPRFAAFNLTWRERPQRQIYSYVPPKTGWLTKPGMPNFEGRHDGEYAEWLGSLSST